MAGRCLSYHSKPDATTVPELPTITTWIRFVIGGLYGVSLGLRDQRGLAGVLFGLNAIAFLPQFWFNTYLGANIESYKSLNFVGVANAFALMLLVWISIFTIRHEEIVSSLQKAISDAVAVVTQSEDVVTPGAGVEGEF